MAQLTAQKLRAALMGVPDAALVTFQGNVRSGNEAAGGEPGYTVATGYVYAAFDRLFNGAEFVIDCAITSGEGDDADSEDENEDAAPEGPRLVRFRALAEKHGLSLSDFGLEDYIGEGGNGPNDIPNYVAFEISSDGTGSDFTPWAYLANTLSNIEADLNQSDTQRDSIRIYSLSNGREIDSEVRVIVDRDETAENGDLYALDAYCSSCDNTPCICEVDSSEQDDYRSGKSAGQIRHEQSEAQRLK